MNDLSNAWRLAAARMRQLAGEYQLWAAECEMRAQRLEMFGETPGIDTDAAPVAAGEKPALPAVKSTLEGYVAGIAECGENPYHYVQPEAWCWELGREQGRQHKAQCDATSSIECASTTKRSSSEQLGAPAGPQDGTGSHSPPPPVPIPPAPTVAPESYCTSSGPQQQKQTTESPNAQGGGFISAGSGSNAGPDRDMSDARASTAPASGLISPVPVLADSRMALSNQRCTSSEAQEGTTDPNGRITGVSGTPAAGETMSSIDHAVAGSVSQEAKPVGTPMNSGRPGKSGEGQPATSEHTPQRRVEESVGGTGLVKAAGGPVCLMCDTPMVRGRWDEQREHICLACARQSALDDIERAEQRRRDHAEREFRDAGRAI